MTKQKIAGYAVRMVTDIEGEVDEMTWKDLYRTAADAKKAVVADIRNWVGETNSEEDEDAQVEMPKIKWANYAGNKGEYVFHHDDQETDFIVFPMFWAN